MAPSSSNGGATGDTMSTWLIRGGRQGQHEQFCLDNGLVGAGWHEVPDLTDAKDWDSLKAIVETVYPGNPGAVPNYTGQLWRLRHDIKPGDTVVLPLKTTSQIAIGRASGPYRYDASVDPYRRHQIPVEWMVTDIPRTAVKRDLLFSMGSAMTVCALSRNDADWRVEQLALTGADPGARPEAVGVPGSGEVTGGDVTGGGEAEDDIVASGVLDVERYALDRLTQVVGERFAGYAMQELVAAILRADGYHAEVPPEGADGGIDVVAGSGPLGLDSPRIIGQVKSGSSRVDAPTVQQLQGAITTHGADHGLLVAWGGLTSQAKQAVRAQRFRLRVWDADDLIEAICRTYERLPDEMQAKLPLKPVWVVVEGD